MMKSFHMKKKRKMILSKAQKEVIKLMSEGYKLKFVQHIVSSSWFLHKNLPDGHIHAINLLKSTCKNLMNMDMIAYDKTDKYLHKYYKLTKSGRLALTF